MSVCVRVCVCVFMCVGVLECVIGLIQLNYVTGSVMNTTILRPPLTPTLHADDSMILSLSFE